MLTNPPTKRCPKCGAKIEVTANYVNYFCDCAMDVHVIGSCLVCNADILDYGTPNEAPGCPFGHEEAIMMPEGIVECTDCGVPTSGYGGGLCRDCEYQREEQRAQDRADLRDELADWAHASQSWILDAHLRAGLRDVLTAAYRALEEQAP